MRRTTALILIFAVVFTVGIPAFAGVILWSRLTESYRGYTGGEQFVNIPPGSSSVEIGRRLAEAGVVPDRYTFRLGVWWTGSGARLKAGEYRFDRAVTPLAVIERLERGEAFVRRITFPEGLSIAEMARLFEARGFGRAVDFVQAARDPSLLGDLDREARDLEGYLFPDTYAMPRAGAAADLVAQMVERFKRAYQEAGAAHRGTAPSTGVRAIVTLASLVEKETATPSERPIVAAVYQNRLKLGMPMQADPTVIYALTLAGRYNGNLRRGDLAFDSPYNTYRYPGLPPGPIASPGLAAIRAALAPADAPYLYFVSRNDGTHAFASALPEHNANVRRFQVEFFRRRAARAVDGR